MILALSDPSALQRAVETLADGGLVGLPTETVYGLGADASNGAAVARIFAAKGRPPDHPLIVHVADMDGGLSGVQYFAQALPDFAQALIAAFWPGALTLILPRRPGVATAATGGQDSVGLRCPSHPGAQALLRALRQRPEGAIWGVAAPSANRFGRVSPTTAAHVQSELGRELLILDGGPCSLGIESTIVDCTRGLPVLLRPGSISAEALSQACGQPVRSAAEFALAAAQPLAGDAGLALDAAAETAVAAVAASTVLPVAPRASGTLESHYAPRARVRLFDAQALQAALQTWRADLAVPQAPEASGPRNAELEVASAALSTRPSAQLGAYVRSFVPAATSGLVLQPMPATAAQTAQELFAVLRALDDAEVQEIWVERVPAGPDWAGVADRLQRASA
jgi:L-threonylcarbamoyladenylate synthase